jgi:hypothetical protein
VRRTALIALTAFFALVATGAAQTEKSSIVQFHNRTSHQLMVVADLDHFTTHKLLFPHDYLVLKDVKDGSCVRVHLPQETQHFDHCRSNGTPVSLSCNLPESFVCLIHHGFAKELVINIEQTHKPLH